MISIISNKWCWRGSVSALEAERTARTDSLQLQMKAIRQIVRYLRPERPAYSEVDGERQSRRPRAEHPAMAWLPRFDSSGERQQRWLKEGEPSVVRFVGQIGVLGWIIVTPTLIGLFVGRWLDHKFGTGIFWSAPLLVVRRGDRILVGLAMDA